MKNESLLRRELGALFGGEILSDWKEVRRLAKVQCITKIIINVLFI